MGVMIVDFLYASYHPAHPLGPWVGDTWCDVLRTDFPPWLNREEVENLGLEYQTPISTWTEKTVEDVRALLDAYFKTTGKAKVALRNRRGYDFVVGRKALDDYAAIVSRQWTMPFFIDNLMEEIGFDPYAYAGQQNYELPSQLGLAAPHLMEPLMGALWDVEAKDRKGLMKPHLTECTNILISLTWARWKKKITNAARALRKHKTKYEESQKALETPSNITREEVSKMITAATDYQKQLTLFGMTSEDEEVDQVEKHMSTLRSVLTTAKPGTSTSWYDASPRVSKALREAMALWATRGQVTMLRSALQNYIDKTCVTVEEEDEFDDDLEDWETGVEHLARRTVSELYEELGTTQQQVPDFNNFFDINGEHDPWLAKHNAWFEKDSPARRPFKLRWHQLCAIVKIMENLLKQSGVLVMDAVGIGKTLEAIGVIAWRAYFLSVFEKQNKFPGKFTNYHYTSTNGNLGDRPTVIVVPPHLIDQWKVALHFALRRNTFDIMIYGGTSYSRGNFLHHVYNQSNQPPHRRIILASSSAIAHDAKLAVQIVEKLEPPPLKKTPIPKGLLFELDIGVVIVDEAHAARRNGDLQRGCRVLSGKAEMVLLLTATPIMGKALDLWNLGVIMKITECFDVKKQKELTRSVNASMRKDRKAMNDSDQQYMLGLRDQHTATHTFTLVSTKDMARDMGTMRDLFRGRIVRRTVDSLDENGNQISGLNPPRYHDLHLKLNVSEAAVFDQMVNEVLESGTKRSVTLGRDFYLSSRQALLHFSLYKHYEGPNPFDELTEESWKAHPSTKLDTLIQICQHHLAHDNAIPLMIDSNRADDNALIVTPDYVSDARLEEGLGPDKIVMYTAFPSQNPIVMAALELHGINSIEIHGKMPLSERTEVLKAFRENTDPNGARVLIISPFAMTGLNIHSANILILVDVPWSRQETNQLLGRLWRYPQPKTVHMYSLIGRDCPDVILHQISMLKGVMHEAFVQPKGKFVDALFKAKMLALGDDEDDDTENESESEVEEVEPPSKKRKAPAKRATADSPRKAPEKAKTPAKAPAKRGQGSNAQAKNKRKGKGRPEECDGEGEGPAIPNDEPGPPPKRAKPKPRPAKAGPSRGAESTSSMHENDNESAAPQRNTRRKKHQRSPPPDVVPSTMPPSTQHSSSAQTAEPTSTQQNTSMTDSVAPDHNEDGPATPQEGDSSAQRPGDDTGLTSAAAELSIAAASHTTSGDIESATGMGADNGSVNAEPSIGMDIDGANDAGAQEDGVPTGHLSTPERASSSCAMHGTEPSSSEVPSSMAPQQPSVLGDHSDSNTMPDIRPSTPTAPGPAENDSGQQSVSPAAGEKRHQAKSSIDSVTCPQRKKTKSHEEDVTVPSSPLTPNESESEESQSHTTNLRAQTRSGSRAAAQRGRNHGRHR